MSLPFDQQQQPPQQQPPQQQPPQQQPQQQQPQQQPPQQQQPQQQPPQQQQQQPQQQQPQQQPQQQLPQHQQPQETLFPLPSEQQLQPNQFPDSSNFADKIKSILQQGDYDDADPEYLLNRHVLFIQMDILCSFPGPQYGWKEMSRWLKFEEKVDASGRWSKPHVSTVSLRAMTQLRDLLQHDKVCLLLDFDTQGRDWEQVRERIVQRAVEHLKRPHSCTETLSSILAAPHKHNGRGGVGMKSGDWSCCKQGSGKGEDEKHIWEACTTYPKNLTPDLLESYEANENLKGKLPKMAETGNVWVGCADFCSQPITILCRFSHPLVLPEASEIDLPTRLLFVALSSQASLWQMYEMGRAVAVLFNDKVFCEVAMKSFSKEDIIVGINEMLDDVCLLPPSLWDPTTRLDPPSLTMTIQRVSKRLHPHMRAEALVEPMSSETVVSDESLQRTGVVFGGLVKDIKRLYPGMGSDFMDGLSTQCLASIFFLYFACITPVVTFGGLMSTNTGGNMGTIEMLITACLCGTTYALFSGQPLTIIGATAPLLVFESILYELCILYNISFLPMRFWIGAWMCVLMLLIVAFDLSAFIKYITRFTEESFTVLIALLFIYEAVEKLWGVWKEDRIHTNVINQPPNYNCLCRLGIPTLASKSLLKPLESSCYHEDQVEVSRHCLSVHSCRLLNATFTGTGCVSSVVDSVPDVFLFSTILLLGTSVVAIFFRSLRSSTYFPRMMRSVLADFAVVLSIVVWTLVDYLLGLDTDKLDVPATFQTTKPGRGWVVNPLLLNPWWMGLLSFFPSCLSTILICLDQHITTVIVNRKENKLQKAHGYHLDLLIIAIQILFCSIFGLPWFCAATIRSISHVQSLVKMTEFNAPGEAPKMLGIREQRVTGLIIHILIGLSILGAVYLRVIPMPVLYGVLFYMGVTSFEAVQFIDRVCLMLMPAQDQPDYVYLRHVNTNRVYLFTTIQVLCSILMWLVKTFHQTSILFPLTLLGLVGVRKAMDWLFYQQDLFWLDNILPERSRRTKEDQIKALDFACQPSQRRRSTRIAENYLSSTTKLTSD